MIASPGFLNLKVLEPNDIVPSFNLKAMRSRNDGSTHHQLSSHETLLKHEIDGGADDHDVLVVGIFLAWTSLWLYLVQLSYVW